MDQSDEATTTQRHHISSDYSCGMMSVCRCCQLPCGDDYSWPKPMDLPASYQCPFGHCLNYHYYCLHVHCQCRRHPTQSILDDSPASANSKNASSVLGRTGSRDGATSSASFNLMAEYHLLHFISIVRYHLLKLKKSSIKSIGNCLTYIWDI